MIEAIWECVYDVKGELSDNRIRKYKVALYREFSYLEVLSLCTSRIHPVAVENELSPFLSIVTNKDSNIVQLFNLSFDPIFLLKKISDREYEYWVSEPKKEEEEK